MGFLSILPVTVLLLVMLATQTCRGDEPKGRFPCGYSYFAKSGSWFKMHTQGANWRNAHLTCLSEGAQLASPSDDVNKRAMVAVMIANNKQTSDTLSVHTAMDSSGKIKYIYDSEPSKVTDLTEKGQSKEVSLDTILPYICYRPGPQLIPDRACGLQDRGYQISEGTQHCYNFHRNRTTWSEAAQSCASEGAYLAIINDAEEAQVIQLMFLKTPSEVYIAEDLRDVAFIGYWVDDQSNWRTVKGNTLTEVGYADWSPGQPKKGKACGSVTRNGKLFDKSCKVLLPYICEKEADVCESRQEDGHYAC